jgi:hypothetical protein
LSVPVLSRLLRRPHRRAQHPPPQPPTAPLVALAHTNGRPATHPTHTSSPFDRSPTARRHRPRPTPRRPKSTPRANPYPEVTDLFCRLPLPTFFYQLEAVHLGDLLRLSVRPDGQFTVPPLPLPRLLPTSIRQCTAFESLPRIFMERQECTGQHIIICAAFPVAQPLSPVNLIPGVREVHITTHRSR